MTDDFAPPAPKIKITEFDGKLLLITAIEVMRGVASEFSKDGTGKSDVTVANVVVIEHDGTGTEYEGLWIFQGGLQGQLRARVGTGKKTLARLVKGPSQKGDFQWMLADPTDQDAALARLYLGGLTQARTGGAPPF
jgi:hypothetical protein